MGFVEGKAAVPVPEWWQHSVLGLKALSRTEYRVPTELPPAPLPLGESAVLGVDKTRFRGFGNGTYAIVGPNIEDITVGDQSTEFVIEGRTLSVSNELLNEFSEPEGSMLEAKWLGEHTCLLAIGSVGPPWPYQLIRIDNGGRKVAWNSQVAASEHKIVAFSGGGIGHWLELIVHEKSAYVFGAGISDLYLECFCIEDGQSQFRFSTSD